jgi:long-chain acyl-CoA synthetase
MGITLGKLTLRELILRSAGTFSDLPALSFADGKNRMTYGELKEKSQEAGLLLMEKGLEKGDKVVLLGDNCPEWVAVYLGVVSLGLTIVPILTGFTENDTRHIIRDSGAKAVFVASKEKHKLEALSNSSVLAVFSLENFLPVEDVEIFNTPEEEKIKAFKEEHANIAAGELWKEISGPEPDDLAAIIYTSGTTGHSKGVMLSHRNITSDVINSIKKFPIDETDRFLSILPLAHTYECTAGMLGPLSVGASIHYMRGLPTPQKLLKSMEQVKPTAVLSVPLIMDKIYRKKVLPQMYGNPILRFLYVHTFFKKLLNRIAGTKVKESLGGELRFFMFGGAALNRDVELFMRDAGISYSTGYGMTETSPILTINPLGGAKVGSCGQAIPEVEIEIRDMEEGIGEIVVRGPNVMIGYYKNEVETKKVLDENGWLRTGDLGYLDEEGFLFLHGRSKNVIVGPSGENIFPEIIEAEILKNNFVLETIVYDKEGKLIAKVHLDSDALDAELKDLNYSQEQTREFINEILEQIKTDVNNVMPHFSRLSKVVEHPDPFEKTPTNKVKRYLYIGN